MSTTYSIRHIGFILLGSLFAALLCLAVLFLFDPAWNPAIRVGGMSMDVGFAAVVAFEGLMALGYLVSVIQGFRTHWGWGVAMFLVPIAFLVFFREHTKRAMPPLIVYGLGCLMLCTALLFQSVR